jgi:hypothetical protein
VIQKGKHIWRDDGWLIVSKESNPRLNKLGYHVGVFNDAVIIYHDNKVSFESEDVELVDNYLKLILED